MVDITVSLTDTENKCYDNESHPLYNKQSNPNPCYTYNDGADTSPDYLFPFDATQDINLAEYIPDNFIDLLEQLLIDSKTNGQYNISEELINQAIDGLELEVNNSFNESINQIAQRLVLIPGVANLYSGFDEFKESAIKGYSTSFKILL